MDLSPAVDGVTCADCDATFDPADATHRCPDCGGFLTMEYDLADVSREALSDGRFDGLGRYAALLPFDPETLVTTGEGTTPLVDCPTLADELDVGSVHVKDEGQNPAGSVTDRGLAVAVTAARETGAGDVALPTTGAAGRSAAAYAARAGLDSHAFVPSRAAFGDKAMVNVHGGEMSVVGGRFGDAVDAFADALRAEWFSVAAFDQPYRREGTKTLAYEVLEQFDWVPPDAVVYPTGEGVGLVGLYKGFRELREAGLIDRLPALYAAQAAGCAPIVEAFDAGRERAESWDRPDTICGGIEVADPAGGSLVLDALAATDGGAVATADREALESAVAVAGTEGVSMGASAGPAASGAWKLAEDDAFEDGDTVVVVNTLAADREADVLRSHLMSKGV